MNPSTGATASAPAAWTELRTASPAPDVVFPPVDPTHVDVSIVLVAYGSARVVLDGVTALGRSLVDDPAVADRSIEVLVVDHPHPRSGTSPADLLALHTAGVRVVRAARNLGFGGGNELGIALARGRVLVLLNPDVLAEPGWLGPLLDAVADPTVGIAAPVLVWPDGRVQEAGVRLFRDGGTAPETELAGIAAAAADDATGEAGAVDVDYSSAACWAVRREVLEQVGGFDAAFHPAYYEDIDLALRVHGAGLRTVVCPDARLVHLHGGSTVGPPPDLTDHIDRFRRRWAEVLPGFPTRPTDARGRADELAHDAAERVLLLGSASEVADAEAALGEVLTRAAGETSGRAPRWEVTAHPIASDQLVGLDLDEDRLLGGELRFRCTIVAAPEDLWTAGLDTWCDRWQPLARRTTLAALAAPA